VDFGLTSEQQMIVDTVRNFVEKEIYPHEHAVEKSGIVPADIAWEITAKCKQSGFFAANMPTEIGGGGLNNLEFTLLERELGRASMALGVFFGRPSGILLACEGEQREKYLLPAVNGDKIDCLAMTEPQAGSDVRGMRCSARQDGDDWIINGSKHFISHADIADFAIVFVATGEEQLTDGATAGPKKKITCFLVDRGTLGFEISSGYNSVSHKGYQNCVLSFDDCRVPSSQILGELHRGFDIANQWLYGTRLTVAANCVGRARRVFDLALNYASEREQFGQKIGRFQGISFKLADMITQIDASDWLTLSAAWRLDQNQDANRQIASAKLHASEMLGMVTDEAIQVFGGMGLMDDLPLERFWRDARVERIWDGTSEIQRHIISRALLRPLGC
jgi:acyl-CoA dehydrogenase